VRTSSPTLPASARVLARLDLVPWAELAVAGVSDEPIPDLLRAVAAADEQTAIDAFRDLQWEILNQRSWLTGHRHGLSGGMVA
jgi:hypothetical protein